MSLKCGSVSLFALLFSIVIASIVGLFLCEKVYFTPILFRITISLEIYELETVILRHALNYIGKILFVLPINYYIMYKI